MSDIDLLLAQLPTALARKAHAYYTVTANLRRCHVITTLADNTDKLAFYDAHAWWSGDFKPVRIKSYPSNADFASPETLRHAYIHKGKWGGLKAVDMGAGHGTVALGMAHAGFDVIAVEDRPGPRTALALACIENNLELDLRDSFDLEQARTEGINLATFGRVFYEKTMARTNIDLARQMARAGIHVVIGSVSLADGDNPHVQLDPAEIGQVFARGFMGDGVTLKSFELVVPHAD